MLLALCVFMVIPFAIKASTCKVLPVHVRSRTSVAIKRYCYTT
ncbi:hypothetical protein HMPREF3190_00731 [Umbribacter vaginalis]|nr:hypothetical protein HMPREF3190_00731 [Coriobacteriales bacterium DNF00809]